LTLIRKLLLQSTPRKQNVCPSLAIRIHNRKIIQIQLNLSMGLQPFVGPWLLFQFLNLLTVGRTPWTGDQPV
jgi:hypothetical protein